MENGEVGVLGVPAQKPVVLERSQEQGDIYFFFLIRNKSNEYFLTTELAIHQLQRMEENLVKELMLTKMSAI